MPAEESTSDIQQSSSVPKECSAEFFGAGGVRLGGRELLVTLMIVTVMLWLAPVLWGLAETFGPGEDYRLAYESGNDYWLYGHYCRKAASEYDVFVVGDSVIWGHYVDAGHTLSHYLTEKAGGPRFANMGVDGTHPAALAGLLKYYGKALSGKRAVLHLNPLWLSSAKHDLSIEKEFHFNHSRLVPQFFPRIPCYRASNSERISAVVERNVPALSWAGHLRISCFESRDLGRWTIENPYANPVGALLSGAVGSEGGLAGEQPPAKPKASGRVSISWVDLEDSLQWRFFRQAVRLLQARGNRVFVLVGPFNEHMMDAESMAAYTKIQDGIEQWLQQNDVAHCMPAALPAEVYVDASHPIADGYDALAGQLCEDTSFRSTILSGDRASNAR